MNEQDWQGLSLFLHTQKTPIEAVLPFLKKSPHKPGILTSIATPYPFTISKLTLHQVRTDRIFFVDYASKKQGKTLLFENNVIFPETLYELGTAIHKLAKQYEYVVFDDISAFFTHHTTQQITQFFHTLRPVLEQKEIILCASQQQTPQEFIDAILPLCNHFVTESP